MKLPKYRALALLGLLLVAGVFSPREGAATRVVVRNWDPWNPVMMGDPDGPDTHFGERIYDFRASSSGVLLPSISTVNRVASILEKKQSRRVTNDGRTR